MFIENQKIYDTQKYTKVTTYTKKIIIFATLVNLLPQNLLKWASF